MPDYSHAITLKMQTKLTNKKDKHTSRRSNFKTNLNLAPPTNIVFINTTIIGHHKKLRLRKFGLNGSVLQLPLMFPLRTR
jgi:hypothetical protein